MSSKYRVLSSWHVPFVDTTLRHGESVSFGTFIRCNLVVETGGLQLGARQGIPKSIKGNPCPVALGVDEAVHTTQVAISRVHWWLVAGLNDGKDSQRHLGIFRRHTIDDVRTIKRVCSTTACTRHTGLSVQLNVTGVGADGRSSDA